MVAQVSYTMLKTPEFGIYHSGDITSAPNGASEFIDIDTSKASAAGARYIIASVLSYTNEPFCNLPQCFVGWMSRDKPNSGEIYEAACVENKIDLASDRRITVPCVIDLQENCIIWGDIALTSNLCPTNNIESNQRGLVHIGVALTSMVKPNLYDLFCLHVKARGRIHDEIQGADIVFSEREGITPDQYNVILSEYLST